MNGCGSRQHYGDDSNRNGISMTTGLVDPAPTADTDSAIPTGYVRTAEKLGAPVRSAEKYRSCRPGTAVPSGQICQLS